MAEGGFLVLALVTGTFLVLVTGTTMRFRHWQSYSPPTADQLYSPTGSGKSTRVFRSMRSSALHLAVLVYVVLIGGILVATIAVLEKSVDPVVFVACLTLIVAAYVPVGLYFVAQNRRWVRRYGYGLKRTVLFRRRPLWSMAVGWATFGTILVVIALVVAALWSIGLGPTGLIGGMAVLALLLVVYGFTTADVESFSGRPMGATAGGSSRTTSTRGSGTRSSGQTRRSLARAVDVMRGWVSIGIVGFIAVSIPLVLWEIRGTVGLLGGIAFLALLAVAYSISTRM